MTRLHGWWEMTIQGETWFFHFSNAGRAAWVSRRPANLTAGPAQPEGKVYWFGTVADEALVCWRDTGTLDRLFWPAPN